jgi:hypothetical protein
LTQQRGDHRPDVLGHADAAKGGGLGHHAADLGIVAHHRAVEVGGDGPRSHGVDHDAARAELARQVAGHDLEPALHHGVGAGAGQGEAGQAAGQVDDPPAVRQHRQQLLGQEVRPLQVDVHQRVEHRFRGLGEGVVGAGPGVVDQVVEALSAPGLPERRAHLGDEAVEARDVAGIQAQGQGLAAQGLDLGHGGVGLVAAAMVGQDHVAAPAGDVEGGVAAQAAAAAGDQGDLGGGGHRTPSFEREAVDLGSEPPLNLPEPPRYLPDPPKPLTGATRR